MHITFVNKSWEEYLIWQKENKSLLKKVNELIKSLRRGGVSIGKREILKNDVDKRCSVRINQEHRLTYRFMKNELIIFSCREHY